MAVAAVGIDGRGYLAHAKLNKYFKERKPEMWKYRYRIFAIKYKNNSFYALNHRLNNRNKSKSSV